MGERRWARCGAPGANALLVGVLCVAGCTSTKPGDPVPAAPATHSAVILTDGDPVVTAAVHRVVLTHDPRLLEMLLEAGAFNDTLSDAEAEAFLALAQRIEVSPDAGARDPQRGARRLIYSMLAARVIATGRWSDAEEWWDATDDELERDDICAGFAVTDWWPQGRVAVARSPEELDEWRETLARLLTEVRDRSGAWRLIRNAHGKLGLLPGSPAEPEDARRCAAEFILRLMAVLKDERSHTALVRALSLAGFARPGDFGLPAATPHAPSTIR